MPTYEYECAKCGEHVEAFQTFSEEPLKRHNQCEGSKCTGALHKVFSPVGIVLKGSGFYKNDSRDSSRSKSKASSSASESTASESKSDSKSSDTKSSDAKSDSKSTTTSDSSSSNGSSSSGSDKKRAAKPAKKSA
jgi:putative FmdB family regulatory protein